MPETGRSVWAPWGPGLSALMILSVRRLSVVGSLTMTSRQ
jgi:hypothetical protein